MECVISHRFAQSTAVQVSGVRLGLGTVSKKGRCSLQNTSARDRSHPWENSRWKASKWSDRRATSLARLHAISDRTATDEKSSDEQMEQQVNKAMQTMDELLQDINRELFVSAAVADITADEQVMSEKQAIKAVVEKRIDSLDDFFVAVLRVCGGAARDDGNIDLADRMDAIAEEVLAQVGDRLPPELRVLDAVQQLQSSEARVDRLKEAVLGSAGGAPQCQMVSLQTVTNQLIDDMEDKELILNRQLLARMCLIREELAVVAADALQGSRDLESEYTETKSVYERLIPRDTAAFVKELLTVAKPDKRRALLKQALEGAFEDKKTKKRGLSGGAVRPGRLLTCLSGLHRELAKSGKPDQEETLKRLERIRIATLEELQKVAYEGGLG